ncbi:MAG: hypothetical protein AAFR88_09505, partial [Pseudomonadota bacterium]
MPAELIHHLLQSLLPFIGTTNSGSKRAFIVTTQGYDGLGATLDGLVVSLSYAMGLIGIVRKSGHSAELAATGSPRKRYDKA